MKPVDQSAAADVFIADVQHERFHDHHLWDLRKGRDQERDHIPEWETLRQLASDIKAHTLTHLADYLEEFERNATANGVQVHWAQNAQEQNRIVAQIFEALQVKTEIKIKSMITYECVTLIQI